ncbi:G-protein coupled receptor [Clarias magur]|uniref:G-protein coupled receptor n=1 Tax=Clarias magur TaxID=1594786 RepID=A0A8J4XHF3_CLAMG|nr:G-protein coupled receptor [Clarias magur]
MCSYMKMSFRDKLLILLLLSFNFRTSSVQEPTLSSSNICSTVEEELAGSMQPPNVSTDPQVEVEEEDWLVPENYLYSGNASLLRSSTCRKSFQLSAQHGAIPQDIRDLLDQPIVSLTNAVNFLNLIFQASELRETSVREDIDWYHALIRSMVVGERSRLVRHALLSFDADPSASQPQLILWASKGSSQDIYLQDLTLAWEKPHLLPHGLNQSWFNLLKSNSQFASTLSKQILLNDLSTLDTPKWAHGGTFVMNSSGLQWGEAPFLECKDGRFQPGWLLTVSLPFYGLKPDLSPEFRGMIRVDVDVHDVDVNQCATGDFWFADTHQCNRTSMKPIRASGFLLLEIVLLGSLLLYFPVLIIFFKPSPFHCILLRWVRLLGFVIVYGTVTLKMYRVLNVFLSCTAQRVPYMSNASVLRMLGVMVLTVKWFLCAWTVGVLQNQDRNIPLLITLTTSDGQSFKVCDWDRWDYMMAMAEMLFLCWGISLSSAVKTVPSAFHEPRYMGIAIHNELLFSTMFHLLRFIKPSLQPDWMLLLFFIHIHVTITVTLGLLFFPKFLNISRLKEDIASEMYEDEVDLRRSCLHLNNSFTSGCWSEHNLDADDIRGELKKLYAQLEVHKTKKMENNNPHLQKKRSSRLMLGRSLIRRLAEIPEGRTQQGSRKGKDASGDEGGSCLANSESTRVIMRNETAKVPSAETQKCVSVKDVSLRNSPVKNCMNKRASETESIDTAPLFCKSVSAQNLAVDNNFRQPVSTRVQKSFSFTEKHRDHYSLSPTNSMLDTSHDFKTKFVSFDKAEVKQEQPRDRNEKHSICTWAEQETLKQKCKSPPGLLYVCPWEFASSLPSSSPPVVKEVDSDVESSRPKPPISSSAPGSPYSLTKAKARSGFSFHSATQTLTLAKGLVPKKVCAKSGCKNTREDEVTSQQTRSATLSSAVKSVRKPQQTPIRSRTCVDSKPCLVKQAAIRASTERTMSLESSRPPWHQGRASLTISRSRVCHWTAPTKTCPRSSIADVCPWEVNQQDDLGFTDDYSTWEVESKQMLITSGHKGICPQESLGMYNKPRKGTEQQESHTEAEEFSFSVKKDPAKSVPEATKPTERVIYVNAHPDTRKQSLVRQETLRAEVCPWETNQEAKSVDVYPWTLDGTIGKYSETIRSTESKSLTAAPSPKNILTKELTSTVNMEICPWEFPGQLSCPWESEKLPKTDADKPRDDIMKNKAMPYPQKKHLTSTTETCPWDFPESLSMVKEVCLLESEEASLKRKQEGMGLPSQMAATKTADNCSRDAEATERSENINIKESDTSVLQKDGVHSKICLWENITQESEQPVNICRWETEQSPEPTQSQNHLQLFICPWELEVSGNSKMQSSVCVDVSPCKTEPEHPASMTDGVTEKRKEDTSAHTAQGAKSNRPLIRCDALCPWDIKGGSQASVTEIDNNSDIFSWEEPIGEEESDAETAAEAFIFPPDL